MVEQNMQTLRLVTFVLLCSLICHIGCGFPFDNFLKSSLSFTMRYLDLALAGSCLLGMSEAALNITILEPGVPFVQNNILPLPHALSDGEEIATLFKNLGRSTVWNLVEKVIPRSHPRNPSHQSCRTRRKEIHRR